MINFWGGTYRNNIHKTKSNKHDLVLLYSNSIRLIVEKEDIRLLISLVC